MSFSVVDATSSATVSGTISAANGTVTVASLAHQDDLAKADGSATKAGAVGIGAAVAISRTDLVNLAQILDGATVTADGITVETGMTDNQVGLNASEPLTVDLTANTMFVGANKGLTTGAAVTYSNGGGDSIDTADGLLDGTGGTIYFVIDEDEGKIKLATTLAKAQAGEAIVLTGLGTGDAHKFTRADVVFDQAVDLTTDTIFVGENTGLTTGAAVTYDNGGGTSIGGLTDDNGATKYFVINSGDGKIKLATSELNADSGTAIDLTGLGTGTAHKFTRADVTFNPAVDVVFVMAETIDVGEDTGLMTGDEVKYSNGGGDSITIDGGGTLDGTGATSYFVIVATGGTIKLATSLANAQADTKIDLVGPGTGTAHKLTRVTPVETTFDPSPAVDVDADTITVGANTGLSTGTAVTYENGGGDSVAIDGGTLTDDDGDTKYFVIEAGGGKIRLATTLANAQAGLPIDLTGVGTGNGHKLSRAISEEINFDPDAKRVELKVARDTAWTTGEPVVYDNGGGTDITGLDDGTTYFVIGDGTEIIELATTQEKALLGEAILLTPGGGTGGTLTEGHHGAGAKATSGAGSEGGVGIAGALGLTISSSDTRASLATGSTVNLADGTDGNTTAGELKISADEDGRNVARSEPTVSGGKFGLGASVAVITPTRGTTAEIEDQAVINGANDVTVMATSELETESYAKAGVDGGVALSPVVAVTLVDSLTLARVGARTGPEPNDPNNADGAPQINTAITGNLTITSDHSGDSESIADGSVESTGAAIGAGVAITITEDTQEARLDRSFTTGGNITVDASGFHDDSAIAKATAAGASDDSTTTVSETTTKIVEHTETFQPPPREVEVPPAPNAFVTYFDTARPKLKGNGNDQAQFDEFVASIKTKFHDKLKDQADYLQANPDSRATVFGSTDTVDTFQSNLPLASRRAEALKWFMVNYLVNKHGLSPVEKTALEARIHTEFFGESFLEVPTGTKIT
jgi:outer membrane protein OmpA-like peptidoglycan-associated protein